MDQELRRITLKRSNHRRKTVRMRLIDRVKGEITRIKADKVRTTAANSTSLTCSKVRSDVIEIRVNNSKTEIKPRGDEGSFKRKRDLERETKTKSVRGLTEISP